MISWETSSNNRLHCSSNLSVESRPIPLSWQETLSESTHLRHISWAERYQWPCCKDHVGVTFPVTPWDGNNSTFTVSVRDTFGEKHNADKSNEEPPFYHKLDINSLWSYRNLGWLRLPWLSARKAVQPPKKTHGIWNLWFPTGWFCLSFRCSTKNSGRKAFPKLSQRAMN